MKDAKYNYKISSPGLKSETTALKKEHGILIKININQFQKKSLSHGTMISLDTSDKEVGAILAHPFPCAQSELQGRRELLTPQQATKAGA